MDQVLRVGLQLDRVLLDPIPPARPAGVAPGRHLAKATGGEAEDPER